MSIDLPNIFDELGHLAGVNRPSAIQISVSLLAALASIGAAVAAWLSARSTANSVQEMRSSRLQQARPKLVFHDPQNTTLSYTRGNLKPTFNIDHLIDKRGFPIRCTNVGLGPSLPTMVQLPNKFNVLSQYSDISNLQAFLLAGGFTVSKANHGITIEFPQGSTVVSRKILYRPYESGVDLPNLLPGREQNLYLPKTLFESFFIWAISQMGAAGKRVHWTFALKVDMMSISGEVTSQKFNFFLSMGTPTYTVGPRLMEFDSIPEWTNTTASISISITEEWKEKSTLEMVAVVLDHHFGKHWSTFNLILGAPRRRIRSWLQFGAVGLKPMKVGDIVDFKPLRDWKNVVPDKTFSAIEKPLNEAKWEVEEPNI